MKVFIPAAGLGSRLASETKFLNKALVTVGDRPAISHVIEKFPEETTFVIGLGYKGDILHEFLTVAYPHRTFEFVRINPFEGEGSGLGLTMLQCKSHLQCPFLFWACDTLTPDPIPALVGNWSWTAQWKPNQNRSQFRTFSISSNGNISALNEKATGSENDLPYVGVSFISDYRDFWKAMENGACKAIETGESWGIRALVGHSVKALVMKEWIDIGSPHGLAHAREVFPTQMDAHILPKANEAIWFLGDRVIKFSADEKFIAHRVMRAQNLEGFVPRIIWTGRNIYAYKLVDGRIFSRAPNRESSRRLFHWLKKFMQPAGAADSVFRGLCKEFYREKTLSRVNEYFKRFGVHDRGHVINGKTVPPLKEILSELNWEWLCDGVPSRFHGDLHFENIIECKDGDFVLLDWRQDFAGTLEKGDLYYDLAKLLHGLIICHELIDRDLYEIHENGLEVFYDFHRKSSLVEIEDEFRAFVIENGWDWHKTQTLTALVYLNIATLHHEPYSHLLFYLGKSMLFKTLEAKN